MEESQRAKEETRKTAIQTAKDWGESPLPPSLLATLIFAQHARPFQFTPMIFPPVLLFTTYLNLQGYKVDSAGTTAAISGLYLLLAGRRRNPFMSKFGARGIIRGATMGLCLANVIGGGLAYTFGSRSRDNPPINP